MMHEPVQKRGRHDLVAHEFRPRAQVLVARDGDRGPFIEIRDEGEKQVRFPALDGRIADLVDDDHVGLRKAA